MTTPSHPVAAIIATASDASQMSPLPSTGISRDVGLQLGDRRPPGLACVVLLGRAGVQGDGGDALLHAHLAGAQMSEEAIVDAHPELRRDGHAVGCGRANGGSQDRTGAGSASPARRPHRLSG